MLLRLNHGNPIDLEHVNLKEVAHNLGDIIQTPIMVDVNYGVHHLAVTDLNPITSTETALHLAVQTFSDIGGYIQHLF